MYTQMLHKFLYPVWAAYLVALVALSLLPVSLQGPQHGDKVLHLLAYAGLVVLWPGRRGPWLVVLAAALGGALEITQGALPTGRCADIWDSLANTVGAGLGWVSMRVAAYCFRHRSNPHA